MLLRPSAQTSLPDDNRELEPPDPIPNSEVKRLIADGSVGFPHVRVGHRQASKYKTPGQTAGGFCLRGKYMPCAGEAVALANLSLSATQRVN